MMMISGLTKGLVNVNDINMHYQAQGQTDLLKDWDAQQIPNIEKDAITSSKVMFDPNKLRSVQTPSFVQVIISSLY
jgi:hypothetical protein